MQPYTLESLRELVASLPPWRANMDDDPLWMRPLSHFGITRSEVDDELDKLFQDVDAYDQLLNLDDNKWSYFDPNLIVKTGQTHIRLDTVLHYMEKPDELWDPDGWFGTSYPVVVLWKGNHLLMDGNNRIIADRLMGRQSKVCFTAL